jgi:hypothetical protein
MGELFDWLRHQHAKHDPDRPPPEGAPPIEFNVAAVDQDGALITRALVIRIDAGLSGTVRKTNPANFYHGPALDTPWVGDISIVADGYAPWTTGADPQVTLSDTTVNITAQLSPSFKSAPDVPVIVRGPLLPWPQPQNYYIDLPREPPAEDRNFLRGDFWGVEMDDAPWVPGVGQKYQRIFSWFLDRYLLDFQQRYLTKYAGYLYTHFLLSAADSLGPTENPGKTPGAGHSLNQFIDTCGLVKRYIKYCHVRLGSKDFQPHNMSPQQWADYADPIMDALIAAKVVDEFSLAWEMNLWNTPGPPLIEALRHCGQKAHAAGLTSWQHFSPHYTSWFADGDPRGRFGWYDDLANDVEGINYQTMGPQWSPQMLQARITDTLWQFGERGNDYLFRCEEDLAFWMWNSDTVQCQVDDAVDANGQPVLTTVSVTPEDANLRGYVACCSRDDVKHTDAIVHGFGNGARRPDGSRL